MRHSIVAALGAALIAGLGASSAAQAALINFSVVAIDGTPGYTGTSMDQSSAFDLDNSLLLVQEVDPHDDSGLTPGIDIVTLSPMDITYGFGDGTVDAPISNGPIIKSWTGDNGDAFTETLTTVDSINRGTPNQIIVQLSGTVSDTHDLFVDTPIFFILDATQFGGLGTPSSAMFTNTTTITGVIPETSTWAMMALGFAALGYAASRRRKARVAMLSA
jgi:hypothetical protein